MRNLDDPEDIEVDIETIAEVIGQNLDAAASVANVRCYECLDTGWIELGEHGWGGQVPCSCPAGRA